MGLTSSRATAAVLLAGAPVLDSGGRRSSQPVLDVVAMPYGPCLACSVPFHEIFNMEAPFPMMEYVDEEDPHRLRAANQVPHRQAGVEAEPDSLSSTGTECVATPRVCASGSAVGNATSASTPPPNSSQGSASAAPTSDRPDGSDADSSEEESATEEGKSTEGSDTESSSAFVVTKSTSACSSRTSTEADCPLAQLVGQRPWRLSRMQPLQILGEGGQATVWKASMQGSSQHIALRLAETEQAKASIAEEARCVLQFRHPHILRTYAPVANARGRVVGLACELHSGGSLWEALHRHSLSHRQMAQIAIDVASGLEYLHGRGFVHLDITPSNVTLATELAAGDVDAPRAVLIVFGLAVKMDAGWDFTVIRGGRGTLNYMAHEMLDPKLQCVSASTDICSLGLVMWSMAAGMAPFGNMSWQKQLNLHGMGRRHLKLPRPAGCSSHWYNLILGCTDPKPLSRPSPRVLRKVLELVIENS